MIGRGAPTIGSNPKTIAILTVTYTKNAPAKPKQNSLEKLFLHWLPILVILKIIMILFGKIKKLAKTII